MTIQEIFDKAINDKATYIHLIAGFKPIIRSNKIPTILEEYDVLQESNMYEFYDYIIRGSIEKDEILKKDKTLNVMLEYENVRIKANISLLSLVPTFTFKIINKELPELKYINDVRPNLIKDGGLILITGTACSGKTTTINVLIDEINKNECRKIVTFEDEIEYVHEQKKSIMLQRNIGENADATTFYNGIDNVLREDADIIVINEIKDKQTMDQIVELLQAGKKVIASVCSNSCVDAINRIVNLYNKDNQINIRNTLSYLLTFIVCNKLVKDKNNNLILVPEIMINNDIIAANLRKDNIDSIELSEVFQNNQQNGSITLVNSLARLYLEQVIDLDVAKLSVDGKDIDLLNRIIMQMRG